MILRDATPEDAPAIAALHAANWRAAYAGILNADYLAHEVEEERLAAWRERLADPAPDFETVVALGEDGSLAGFSSLYHAHDTRWGGFLDNLHTDESLRGAGYGQALLRETARRFAARDPRTGFYLWVFEDNRAARRFYARMGAEESERVPSDWTRAPDSWKYRCHWTEAYAVQA